MATKNGQQKAVQSNLNGFFGAGNGTRTRDLRITNALLYQLSYFGNHASLMKAVQR